MSPKSSRRLLNLLRALTQRQKGMYYKVCGLADRRLTDQGYRSLNVHQCEMICERLQTNRDVTMREIIELAGGKIREPAPPPTPTGPLTLFDSSDDGSSSSSDQTKP